jgi:hypothetical protein
MKNWYKGKAMLPFLFSVLPFLSLGVETSPRQLVHQINQNNKAKSETRASFGDFEFQIPKGWGAKKIQGEKIRWVLGSKNGASLSISLEPLETKLSSQQYLMDRLGRLGEKSTPKYYGGNSTGISYLGIEFNMQTGKDKASRAKALVTIFETKNGKIRFVATGESDLFLKQSPWFKRLLFTFRAKGKPIPQRIPSAESAKPRSMPSGATTPKSQPSTKKTLPPIPQKKNWVMTKVGDLSVSFPKAWKKTKPSNSMRLLELHLKTKDGEGVLSAYYFGPSSGSIRMNLDRWKGQFQDPKNIIEKEIKGANFETTLLSLDGSYGGGMGGKKAEGRSRLFAWITRTPKGPFYFKLVGPKKVVDAWESELLEVAKGIR